MKETTIAISCKLTTQNRNDIDLTIHRLYAEQSSPCVIIENGDRRGIGGHIQTVEEIFEDELAKRSGYIVKDQTNFVVTL